MSGLSTPTRPWPRGRGAKCSCGGDLLPDIRVVVRFDFRYRDRPERAWLLIENGDAELYAFDPGPKEVGGHFLVGEEGVAAKPGQGTGRDGRRLLAR
jgi:hypothetical protein